MMRKSLVVILIAVLLLFVGSCRSAGPRAVTSAQSSTGTASSLPETTHEEAPVVISRQSDGQVLHVNLVKFVGAVSSADTSVFVNNTPAVVANDGSYYAFLDLEEGRNYITIRTGRAGISTFDRLTVTFEPPVAVVLDQVDSRYVDYSGNKTIQVTGTVNNPAATVAIFQPNDGTVHAPKSASFIVTPVSVKEDGTFSTMVTLPKLPSNESISIVAVARLGTEVATFFEDLGGLGGARFSTTLKISPQNQTLDVRPGDTGSFDCTLVATAYDAFPSTAYVAGLADPASGGNRQTLDLDGIWVFITPDAFTIYPNIDYHVSINVKPDTDVPPGTYSFELSGIMVIDGPGSMETALTVIVGPSK